MTDPDFEGLASAEVVLPARPFDETLAFFTGILGFRVAAIHPADDPSCAVVVGHGLRLRLDATSDESPGRLRLAREGETPPELRTAPNGTQIELVPSRVPIALPELRPAFTLARLSDGDWKVGRADMRYRDLLPDRQGGRFGASHIQIEKGGTVADYVHYHRVRFQLIYCYRGWVRLAYEDQGPEFVMQAGDCVLQPPEIRHRVLESSPGLQVVELSSPAEHETLGDLEMSLPTGRHEPDRLFSGQRFVHHVAESAAWTGCEHEGFEARVLGLGDATGGLLEARVLRTPQEARSETEGASELLFRFVLEGAVEARLEGQSPLTFETGDSFHVPAGVAHSLRTAAGTELLEVEAPCARDRRT